MKRFVPLILQIASLVLIFIVVVSVFPPLLPFIGWLLVVGCIIVLIMGLLAPFEALGWWAGWSNEAVGKDQELVPVVQQWPEHREVSEYIVYLGGIGAVSGDILYPEEIAFLNEIEARVPNVVIVKDVFPYAMNNRGLTSQGFFGWAWRTAQKLGLSGKIVLKGLVLTRNLFQVAVSADRRYGPIYNYGVAEVIRDGLLRQGYRVGSGIPITVICYSGGGQISLGAATYLQPVVAAPLQVISLGGVMSDDPGLTKITHVYHLYGSRDPVQELGQILYAGRWPFFPSSPWNQAKAEGKITMIAAGPLGHLDPGGYFEMKSKELMPNYHVIDIVTELIVQFAVESHKFE